MKKKISKWDTKNKEKIKKYIESLSWYFDCGDYKFRFTYLEEENPEYYACMSVYYTSREIKITICPSILSLNKAIQANILIHELCHVMTNKSKRLSLSLLKGDLITTKEIEFENESTTEWMGNILVSLCLDDHKFKRIVKSYIK